MTRGVWSWCFEDGWYEHLVIFDIDDTEMLFKVSEYEQWCQSHLGYVKSRMLEGFKFVLYFKNEEDATMCKLSLGGNYLYDKLNGEENE